MKRILYFLLLVLFIASTFGTAEAATRRKQPKKPVTVDMDNGGERDGDGDRDRDRPKRGPNIQKTKKVGEVDVTVPRPGPISFGPPMEFQLKRAASKRFDLRSLPARRPREREKPEREGPAPSPVQIDASNVEFPAPAIPGVPPVANPPSPPPNIVFEGLDRFTWGSGSPPDTTGDVGPSYYIQAVNSSVGIYDKAGNQQAAFTFDTLMSQGAFGNQCDTENFGDPVVLYDTFEDRWVLTDFAFTLDGGGNVNPPIAFQCFAVSMTGNPLTGGWNFYSIAVTDGLNDYPKLGVWTDGIYMSSNVFGYPAAAGFITARAWAFNKQQMYAGAPTVQVVAFNVPGGDFTVIPSNARLQTGTPPPGRPNLFISSWQFLNALTVYKFHADWNSISLSTFTGPDAPLAATSWPNAAVANAPQPGTANLLDVLQIRAMVQNTYTNFGGTESLWVPHTVRRANTTGFAAPRWYQVNVTGGTVNPAIPQAATWDPDGANTNHRYMPSLALNRNGDMAMGYSISNSTTRFPSMAYAGRLAADPVNTFGQTETFMFTGTASQTTSTRWGDYSSMMLDPDGCTFWYTSEYANPASQVANMRWLTKIGSFTFPGCTTFNPNGGTVTGTVTVTPGGSPISGATITFGARSTTTNGSGVYSFLNIPAGTYPSISATKPGYSTASASSIVVTDLGTTVQDFALSLAPTSACLTDTTQGDFQTGVGTNVDVTTAPGNVTLLNAPTIDQQNTAGTTTGTGVISNASWAGQTFTEGVTGQLVQVDFPMFCSSAPAGTPCTLNPNLSVSIRATSGGLPTGANLATASIAGNISGSTATFTATFGAPPTLNAGTQYALIVNTGSTGAATTGYFWIRSSPSTYAGGQRVTSADSGGTWAADSTRDYNFHTYVQTGYAAAGNLVSSNKDSNPLAPLTPIWTTLSWNGSTPANTSLQFQVAGSNNAGGPFTFVGPDGTAGTFYTTSPGSLTPLYNLRYAKYKAYLATTNSAATPVLNDVTMCFNNVDCTAPISITPTPATVCPSSTGNTASGPAGATSYSWSITNGTITSATNIQSITYTAGASGNVGLTLNIVEAGGCQKSANTNVPINPPAPASTSISGPTTACTGTQVQYIATSTGATSFQWYRDATLLAETSNTLTIASASAGDQGTYTAYGVNSCGTSPVSNSIALTVNPPAPASTSISGPTTACAGAQVQYIATSAGATSFQWYRDATLLAETSNTLTIAAASAGDQGAYTAYGVNSCGTSPVSNSITFALSPAAPASTSISGPTTACTGTQVQYIATSTGATSFQWYRGATLLAETSNTLTIASASAGDQGAYTAYGVNSCGTSPVSNSITLTVNPPAPASTSISGPTTACPGTQVQYIATSVGATSFQWYRGATLLAETSNTLTIAAASAGDNGTYTAYGVNSCGTSPVSNSITLALSPAAPASTTISGPSTACPGTQVQYTATSAGATSFQWYRGATLLAETSNTLTIASVSAGDQGAYTAYGVNSCGTSPVSNSITLTLSAAAPAAPVISGPTSACVGTQVQYTATSAGATSFQWYRGATLLSETSNTLTIASASAGDQGTYTAYGVNSCGTSPVSNSIALTVNPNPNATITAPGSVVTLSTGNAASVANAGVGATYNWSIVNGTITAGAGTANITFTAGVPGTLTLQVTVTTAAGCSDTKSTNVTVTVGTPAPTITSIVPPAGKTTGGKNVTINGTGFQSGATITFGGNAATNIVFVNSTKLTAKTPAHAAGFVNVTVTNPDTQSATAVNGYKYVSQQFDANGDNIVDPSDIFYLVNYLFLSGPQPAGASGLDSGDANGDGVVDPSDIFYLVSYLFLGGPAPAAEPSKPASEQSVAAPFSGSLTFGEPVLRGKRYVIPVIMSAAPDSEVPQALSLRAVFKGDAPRSAVIHRAGGASELEPAFEISRSTSDALAYLLAFDARNQAFAFASGQRSGVIAEIELDVRAGTNVSIEMDPSLTMLVNAGGTRSATVSAGTLRVQGTALKPSAVQLPKKERE